MNTPSNDSPSGKSSLSKPSADWRQSIREAGPYLGLGAQLAGTMVFFTVGGYFLDLWLGTPPWMTVAGAVVAVVGVFAQIFRMNAEMSRGSGKPAKPRNESDKAP